MDAGQIYSCRRPILAGKGVPKLGSCYIERSRSLLEAFSRSQDVLRVFFGVLFWMSLFFWSCAWDGRSSIGPNKRS
ncbi:unnamed protein product [Spirodela intermedia]|uniref:Uncharacterized protein n=1 Tax=Spirodela intermedia TaxID=51605 RepID=A0A7I8J5W7_SPIIN|nr:unnamed protein product [Spirodela intermedia]CAA6665626.1 unnamed protein product [Spirodela intermedia]